MRTEVFSKIISGKGHLSVDDLSPDEKKRLSALMSDFGATAGFTYDRFFQKGFRRWELEGIRKIKSDFLKQHEKEMLESVDDDGDKGYAFALSLDNSKGGFYKAIGEVKGLRSRFLETMKDKGMGSPNTIISRFSEDNWKPYEEQGIENIINQYCKQNAEKAKESKDYTKVGAPSECHA